MKNEKKSGNVKISKEILVVCLLILFFIILVIVGRFIRGKFGNQQNNENEYAQSNAEPNISQDTENDSGEKVDGIDTLENYELVTETLKISDFEVSEKEDRLDIIGNIENLTNEPIENVHVITKIFNEKNNLIQEASTTISVINAKSSKQYSFSKFSDYKEVKKVKVEVLKDDIIQSEGTANVNKADND